MPVPPADPARRLAEALDNVGAPVPLLSFNAIKKPPAGGLSLS